MAHTTLCLKPFILAKLPSIVSFNSEDGCRSQCAALSTFVVQCSRILIQLEGTKSRVRVRVRVRARERERDDGALGEMDSTA